MKIRTRYQLLFASLMILAALSLSSCTKPAVPEKAEKLRIAIYPDTVSALIYIAQEQGFFKRHGLDVSLENYQTGVLAVNGLIAGKADVGNGHGVCPGHPGLQKTGSPGYRGDFLFGQHGGGRPKGPGDQKP